MCQWLAFEIIEVKMFFRQEYLIPMGNIAFKEKNKKQSKFIVGSWNSKDLLSTNCDVSNIFIHTTKSTLINIFV